MFETRDFDTMMPHTVQVTPYTGRDKYGKPTYNEAATVSYTCRIVGKGMALRRDMNDDDTLLYDIYLDGEQSHDAPITVWDKLTIPAPFNPMGSNPIIFAVGRYADDDGEHHVKLQCGWMYHRQGQ